jgi:hypothetical protein
METSPNKVINKSADWLTNFIFSLDSFNIYFMESRLAYLGLRIFNRLCSFFNFGVRPLYLSEKKYHQYYFVYPYILP